MNDHLELDPLDVLRAADPVDADRLPSASLARIRARVQESVMTTTPQRRFALPRPLSIAAAGVAAVALGLALIAGRGSNPGVLPGASPGTGSAQCVEPYSPAALANRGFAFDGTVTAIDGDRVTFAVNEAFKGVDGASVTVTAAGMTGTAITSAGGPTLEQGKRYLVAGDDLIAWACGYTQLYDAAVAAEWAAATGS